MHHFFATCPRGLEAILQQELLTQGASQVLPSEGGVAFSGDFSVMARANMHSRTASRVLWQIAPVQHYRNEHDIYRLAATVDWHQHMGVDHTLRVDVTGQRCPLPSLEFVTLRIKDAICDHFRTRCQRRPSVNTQTPDVRVHAYLNAETVCFYLDTSGEALFKRGYRQQTVLAPMRENLAAGLLALLNWQPKQEVLLDPMCGSGTLLIEAALMAEGRAPGLHRAFGYENLLSVPSNLVAQTRKQAEQNTSTSATVFYGGDLDPAALAATQANWAAAGLASSLNLSACDVLEHGPHEHDQGLWLSNPPYGIRLDEQAQLAHWYPQLGYHLKRSFSGWRAGLLTADLRVPKLIGLKPQRRIPLFNGSLECRLYQFNLVRGHLRPQSGS